MAKTPFETPVARRVGNALAAQTCACDCGTVSGAGGGSGAVTPLNASRAVAAAPRAKKVPAVKPQG